jgi:hypothetical protein
LKLAIQDVKAKGGFYRMNKVDNKKILEAINLETGEYHPTKKLILNLISRFKGINQ